MWISPKHVLTDFSRPLTIDQKIDLFAEQVIGWKLNIAEILINGGKDDANNFHEKGIHGSGFAVLDIVFSYFEMIAKFYDGYIGNNSSQRYFKKGIRLVFPEIQGKFAVNFEGIEDHLYSDGRCMLYHSGFLDGKIMITGDFPKAIGYDKEHNRSIINPHKLPSELIIHFSNYIIDLKDTKNVILRANFEKRFDYLQQL